MSIIGELYEERDRQILDLIAQYGSTDGAHHKQWLLDQVVRKFFHDNEYRYNQWVKEFQENNDYEWDQGIIP